MCYQLIFGIISVCLYTFPSRKVEEGYNFGSFALQNIAEISQAILLFNLYVNHFIYLNFINSNTYKIPYLNSVY